MLDDTRDHGVAFLDIETTGLYPWAGHQPWEIALITQEPAEDLIRSERVATVFPWVEYVWHLPVDLGNADPIALNIGRFHERHGNAACGATGPYVDLSGSTDYVIGDWAKDFTGLTHGKHIVGAVPWFDTERFLERYLRDLNACPTWHYHLIDIEALAVGYLAGRWAIGQQYDRIIAAKDAGAIMPLPWDSEELTRAVGVDPDDFDKHTALGDARWAKAIYEAVTGR